jgi:oligosaccharide repeat unit polymerase
MILIAYILIFCVFMYMYAVAPLFLDSGFIAEALMLDFVVIAMFVSYYSALLKKNIFRHSVFFLYGFIIVHFQYLIIFCIQGSVNTKVDIWVDRTIVCKSLIISSIGMLVFIVGYINYTLNSGLQRLKKATTKFKEKSENRRPIVLIIFAYFAFLGFIYTADAKYLSGLYGSVDPGPMANRLQLILNILIGAIIIINARNLIITSFQSKSFYQHVKKMGLFSNILIFTYVILVLFIGDRGPAITIILFYMASYVFRVKDRPKPAIIIAGLIIGGVLMTFVGIYRNVDNNLSFSKKVEEAFLDKNSTGQTSELAGSVRSLHYAVSSVPSKVKYKYGWFQLRQVIVAVPGSAFLLDYFEPNYEDKGSPNLITYFDQGRFYSYGLGSTIIADFYIDLGLLGVIAGMFVFGYFMAKFEYTAYSNMNVSYLLFVFIMVFMSKSIYFSRSTALSAFQDSVWIYIVVTINQYLFKNFGHKFNSN